MKSRDRRKRILEGAEAVILRSGLKGTTMEMIAREAGVAKATLYSYFPDKEAIYTALVEVMAEGKLAAFHRGIGQDGPFDERIGEALAGKLGVAADLLARSPHADELLNAHHRLAGTLKALDNQVEAELAGVLAAEGVPDPEITARMLLASAYGILAKIPDPEEMRKAIRLLAKRVLGGGDKS
ncbi:TetR/AcrR family transcriptional regulator [Pelagibacterium xiamenense]|uniref:TetR/AcrR family transcriptional regulator n=1 Tax=Pelagibacterium xiamenense TaxID=2901140 RepID=UPI001E5D38FB|nr:TetR/AcrR family transcriptional regulator [Pelagibacterium xiamenense]MCD7059319.1 TetR/AcrR family transcriptional regulator [Pelagibacterium xiamenense]